MNNWEKLPVKYLQARLGSVEAELLKLPRVCTGKRRNRTIIREYYLKDGKGYRHEHYANTPSGQDILELSNRRKQLIAYRKQLILTLKEAASPFVFDAKRIKAPFGRAFWDNKKLRADMEETDYDYEHKGVRYNSRAEVLIAQTLDSLGLRYVYEPLLVLGDDFYYPDFAVFLPEFGRCFFIEFLGRLNEKDYSIKNGVKLGDYMHNGMVVDRDLLIFCGTKTAMPSVDEIICGVSSLIDNLCRLYSSEPSFSIR